MENSSRGVLLFAENNERINYVKLAIISAHCVKNHMGRNTKVSLITTQRTLDGLDESERSEVKSLFDKIITTDYDESHQSNVRVYRDTRYHEVRAKFQNKARSSAYNLTPYDETLLIDVDYFVLNDSLNSVWGCNEDFLINKSAKTLFHKELQGPEFRLNPFGVRMYWATIIYFKKSEKAKLIFDLIEHVKETWNYYKHVYDFSGALYRNDFAFSIALHMLNGFIDDEDFVKSFPDPAILTAIDTDQFISFDDKESIRFYANDTVENYKFYISKVKGVNVHCLNKISLLNNYEKIMKVVK